jgi:hypothetical protein
MKDFILEKKESAEFSPESEFFQINRDQAIWQCLKHMPMCRKIFENIKRQGYSRQDNRQRSLFGRVAERPGPGSGQVRGHY